MLTKLRHLGIYQPPHNQRRVFVLPVGDELHLFDVEFGATIPSRYIVHADGKLTNWFGDFPVWTIDDLVDTGETQINDFAGNK